MENLIVNNDKLLESLNEYSLERNVNQSEIICTMAQMFAQNLPYSMDPYQEEYVSGSFINVRPMESSYNNFFKFEENVFKAMVGWRDTFKSGVLLQICFVFQKMLEGEIPNDYDLDENFYTSLGIDKMTKSEKYNRNFFETLKRLPEYYKIVNSVSTIEERREKLSEIYEYIRQIIGNKIGGFEESKVKEGITEIIRKSESSISWRPYKDLEMLYYFKNVDMIAYPTKLSTSLRYQKLLEMKNNGFVIPSEENRLLKN